MDHTGRLILLAIATIWTLQSACGGSIWGAAFWGAVTAIIAMPFFKGGRFDPNYVE
jgi:hypothetical protein